MSSQRPLLQNKNIAGPSSFRADGGGKNASRNSTALQTSTIGGIVSIVLGVFDFSFDNETVLPSQSTCVRDRSVRTLCLEFLEERVGVLVLASSENNFTQQLSVRVCEQVVNCASSAASIFAFLRTTFERGAWYGATIALVDRAECTHVEAECGDLFPLIRQNVNTKQQHERLKQSSSIHKYARVCLSFL